MSLKGFKKVIVGGLAIVPALQLSGSVRVAVLGAVVGLIVIALLTFFVRLLNKWFKGAEVAVLTLALAGTLITIVSSLSSFDDLSLVIMVVIFVYIIAVGTDNFNRKSEISWGMGAAVGFAVFVCAVGLLRFILPQGTGYAFISAAFITAASKKILKGHY